MNTMMAMVLAQTADITEQSEPLEQRELVIPKPASNEVLIRVHCCGVCHTELDEIEGRLTPSVLPRVLGHQVVGTIVDKGGEVVGLNKGDRVGVAWVFSSCGHCEYCLRGDDNLCPEFMATGKDADGGYAEYMLVPQTCAFLIPTAIQDTQAAPLLCAGAIGYRSLRLAAVSNGQTIGMTGFGASAHIMLKMINSLYPDSPVYVFARHEKERHFALSLGAAWVGNTDEHPPMLCSAIIDTTPAWFPIIKALENIKPGGRLVINAIRKENADQASLLDINYEKHLWQEKEIKSVANVSRRDVKEFLELAQNLEIAPKVKCFSLEQANKALLELKFAPVEGAKVLMC